VLDFHIEPPKVGVRMVNTAAIVDFIKARLKVRKCNVAFMLLRTGCMVCSVALYCLNAAAHDFIVWQIMFCEKYVQPGMDDICLSALEPSTIMPSLTYARLGEQCGTEQCSQVSS
jgi:hypothetical protein